MEKNKPKVQTILESIFDGAVEKLQKSDSGQVVSAWLVQLDMAAGEVQVYDDREVLLSKNIIFEWAELSAKNPRLFRQAFHFIRVSLAALKTRRTFDSHIFMRPFKVMIVDDNFAEIETVFVLEGSDGLSEGRLMKNLEQDLQNFSKKIFADLE
jgi:hypothetical protein